jgi:hypoxanthine phosphoribosyltransferase
MNKQPIAYNELTYLVSKICRNILISDWRPDYIVGITRGGLVPAVLISQYLNVPMHTLHVSLRDGSECESNLWMAEDALGPQSKHRLPDQESTYKNILIVDDINDTGATLDWIMKDWPSGCFPDDPAWDEVWNNNVKFAVLVDNLASKCGVKMDFVGMEVNKAENDVWIDFPWEDWWTK